MRDNLKNFLLGAILGLIIILPSIVNLFIVISYIDNVVKLIDEDNVKLKQTMLKITNQNKLNIIKNRMEINVLKSVITSMIEKDMYPYSLEVVATAYTNSPKEISRRFYDGKTALNIPVGLGIVAVDPKYIPLGTIIYIPQFKRFYIALDTGSKIKGNRIDIYMDNRKDAIRFGRKRIEIIICGKLNDLVLRTLMKKTIS